MALAPPGAGLRCVPDPTPSPPWTMHACIRAQFAMVHSVSVAGPLLSMSPLGDPLMFFKFPSPIVHVCVTCPLGCTATRAPLAPPPATRSPHATVNAALATFVPLGPPAPLAQARVPLGTVARQAPPTPPPTFATGAGGHPLFAHWLSLCSCLLCATAPVVLCALACAMEGLGFLHAGPSRGWSCR